MILWSVDGTPCLFLSQSGFLFQRAPVVTEHAGALNHGSVPISNEYVNSSQLIEVYITDTCSAEHLHTPTVEVERCLLS